MVTELISKTQTDEYDEEMADEQPLNDTIYDDEFRESMAEDDEITSWEEAFMKGYNEAKNKEND